jgi:phosphatidate cytidylyltransferase
MRQRAQTAIVLFVAFAVAVLAGDLWFWAGVLLALCLAAWEWLGLFGLRGAAGWLGVALGLVAVMMVDARWPDRAALGPGVAFVMVAALAVMVQRAHTASARPATELAATLAGGLYIGWMGAHLASLRALPEGDGLYWTLTVLPTVFAADITAYLAGRQIGRRKLAPRISPGKTWEGYLAGAVGAVVAGGLLGALWPAVDAAARTTAGHGAAVGLLCGLLCVLGDLGISAIKREFGAKDSSRLLPGHGGVLDRLDTLLVAGVIGYYYVLWFVG